MKKILNHFELLGGLFCIKDYKMNNVDFENEISLIKKYLNSEVEYLLWDVLKHVQGCYFNKNVGFDVSVKIPILGDSIFLDFGGFLTLHKEGGYILSIMKNNPDLFGQKLLPFAEATPGDFIAIDIIDNSIYFISHDFAENEKFYYKIAPSLTHYLLHLYNKKENINTANNNSPIITSTWFSDDF